jgi:PleD family two-component response regulator
MHDEIENTEVVFEGMKIHVNTSMGAASYKDTSKEIDGLIDRADKAMYYSKTHGRGMIVIDGRYEE